MHEIAAHETSSQYLERLARAELAILDLGSGAFPIPGADHLDRDPAAPHVEYVGDIRALWRDGYGDAGNLADITPGAYDVVVANHFVEHIEWIYQDQLFDTVYQWLRPGGEFIVATMNLAYVLRHYTKRRLRRKFPVNEHPAVRNRDDCALQRWLNFRLFSGCGLGDYHHCAFDAPLLTDTYDRAGFTDIHIRKGSMLYAYGSRRGETLAPGDDDGDYEFL